MESVKVLGIVDIEVVAAGSVFLGTVHEPIKGTKNPQAMLNSGVAFTKKPKALRFDYKVKLAPEKNRIRSTGFSRKSMVAGQDSIAAILLLQKRWEDKDGNIYAKRVGTIVQRYTESSNSWIMMRPIRSCMAILRSIRNINPICGFRWKNVMP